METWNADFIDAQYRRWKKDPDSVTQDWQFFFKGFELALGEVPDNDAACTEDQALRQTRVEALTHRYRDIGHLLSCIDPLVACPTSHPLLDIPAFGLDIADLDATFYTDLFPERRRATLKEIVQALRETYCRSIGVEYMHIQDPTERKWLQDRMEPIQNKPRFSDHIKRRLLNKLYQSSFFESYLNKKYPGQTRFSLEGADTIISILGVLLNHAGDQGVEEIILGMAHRGRLNVQANVLMKPYHDIFCEFENTYDPDSLSGAGDVKYHKGYVTDIQTETGKTLRVALMSNPSHLESVNPVVEGFVRGRQAINHHDRKKTMPLLIHGDAAFAGQGIVAEVLNMSQLSGYHTGGTLHLVINNQIGYTTLPENARSTRYSTDIAKMLMVPIFHVHGEDPEAAAHVIQLACDYRNAFSKDAVVDVIGFRRYGHNEGDEPYFTQPTMYERIRTRPPVYQIYGEKLQAAGVLDSATSEAFGADVTHCLDVAYEAARKTACTMPITRFYENWEGYTGRYAPESVKTGVATQKLVPLSNQLTSVPQNFSLHAKLQRMNDKRQAAMTKEEGIDWSFAEALAFGSLLAEGVPVRLSGQDSRRGTFSQRHSVLVDQETGATHIPLNHLQKDQAVFSCHDSLLSEAGVLGFEYGYALARPDGLTLWEAQFGDFVNGAQNIIDLYIASGETKWQRLCGLVLLLPHGSEGMGPEHSSARPERFLQLCADDNIQVCQPTTPAQYFHLLRRQAIASYRKPLVVLTPKSLMRHPMVVSRLQDLASSRFQEVLDDPAPPKSPKRVLLCSGKIYYELSAQREQRQNHQSKKNHTAIVRVEQYYPFPENQIKDIVTRYQRAGGWYWVQDEPENMGAWQFMRPRLEGLIGKSVGYVGRKASASPASGIPSIYRRDQAMIINQALGAPEGGTVSS